MPWDDGPEKQDAAAALVADVGPSAPPPDDGPRVLPTSLTQEEKAVSQHVVLDLEKGIDTGDAKLAGFECGQSSHGHMDKESNKEDDDLRCRVCHLAYAGKPGSNETMQLGCHCKNDLAMAHRDCAEAWFKIKGNRICEICGATAENIIGNEDADFMDQWNDRDPNTGSEPQARCWQSLSLCNFFLACMVVTFILLWLFRVTVS